MNGSRQSEYIPPFKWTTFWYASFIVGGLLISGTTGVVLIKDDISDLGKDIASLRKEEILSNKNSSKDMKNYVDSLHREDLGQFEDLWNAVRNNKNLPKHTSRVSNIGCVIEKVVNGKRVFIPVDCQ